LRYVYQRLGFQCFVETLFEDAGNHFFEGDLDPRVVVSYYPELRGSLFNANDTMDIFAGVVEHMPQESSVDDISRYHPYGFPYLYQSSSQSAICGT
jgi:vacuolar protein sorting-associated protein 3